MHKGHHDGCSCGHMESLLQETASGNTRGVKKWYATAHAAQCSGCGEFLDNMGTIVTLLRGAKHMPIEPAVLDRLRKKAKESRPAA